MEYCNKNVSEIRKVSFVFKILKNKFIWILKISQFI